jgi:hypothetical protein
VRNAANIVVQERRRTAATTREVADKAARDKAYRATDNAEEEGRVVEAVALSMASGLLGKEEEDHWQVRMTHRRSAARDLTGGSRTRNRPRRGREGRPRRRRCW